MLILEYKRRKMSVYIYNGYLLSSLFGCKDENLRQIQKTQSPSPFPLWNVDNHRGKEEGWGTQKQAERKNQGNPNTYKGVVRVLVAMPRLRKKGAPPPWPVVACKPSLRPHLLQSSNLFTVQLISLLFACFMLSQNSSIFLGFRVLNCGFLGTRTETSFEVFSFWCTVMLFKRLEILYCGLERVRW